MFRKIILSVLIVGVIGSIAGTYMFNKPLESTSSMKADYTLNPNELLAAFEQDEVAANTKYLDKVLVVNGVVDKVEKTEKKTTVYLETDNVMSSVIFQMEDSNANIAEGNMISLKGICTGYLMDVVMVRAIQL